MTRLTKVISNGMVLAAIVSVSFPANLSARQVQKSVNFGAVSGFPMKDFDSLEGVWNVESHSLKDRMSGEKVWLKNQMETTYRVLLGGLVVINETYGTFNSRPMHGIMIRTFDSDKNEWRFQWMSKGYPHLTEQVRGKFSNGVGVFFGTEVNKGTTYKMRFRWKMTSKDHACWEQSYQNAKTKEWEPNWTLELRRK